MKTLKESILADMEDVLDRGQDDLDKAMNVDTLPTVKDFERDTYDTKWHQAKWYCPKVLQFYRSQYPDVIPQDADNIVIILDNMFGRIFDCEIRLFNSKTKSYVPINGWHDGFVGANLRKYKQMAIDILTKIAKNPDKMEKLLMHTSKYIKKQTTTQKSLMIDL